MSVLDVGVARGSLAPPPHIARARPPPALLPAPSLLQNANRDPAGPAPKAYCLPEYHEYLDVFYLRGLGVILQQDPLDNRRILHGGARHGCWRVSTATRDTRTRHWRRPGERGDTQTKTQPGPAPIATPTGPETATLPWPCQREQEAAVPTRIIRCLDRAGCVFLCFLWLACGELTEVVAARSGPPPPPAGAIATYSVIGVPATSWAAAAQHTPRAIKLCQRAMLATYLLVLLYVECGPN